MALDDFLKAGYRVQQTTRILPARPSKVSDRPIGPTGPIAREAADRFYHNATPLAKFVYSKIEERYATLPAEEKYIKRKIALMAEAKSILNEHRNQIVDVVIPMFDIRKRSGATALAEGEALPEADQHAHDYFIRNVFAMYYRTLTAWLPEFVHEDQLPTCETTLERLYGVHQERLESELRNFEFGFRKIVAPK